MGGGLMQLVAYGAQDIYLSGNPQITFFKVVYRRHTNFSMESIEQTFNGTTGFGRKVTCTVSRNGDLINRMYLQMDLPALQSGGYDSWVGHKLVKSVEIEIGGQRIDKHYGDWLHIWNELSQTASHWDGYKKMVEGSYVNSTPGVNNVPMNNVVYPNDISVPSTDSARTVYVPLQFWFCRNPGLALPLIALQYHEVKLNIEFAQLADVVVSGVTQVPGVYSEDQKATRGTAVTDAGPLSPAEEEAFISDWNTNNAPDTAAYERYTPASVADSGALSASLYVDYVYLDTDERRRFAQVSHEYLIEQLQFTGDETASPNIKLNLNHPVKEIVWVEKESSSAKVGDYVSSYKNAQITLNSHERFSKRMPMYFQLVQPYQHHERVPVTDGDASSINVYSFALKPEEHQPSGSCNMSRIDNSTLKLEGVNPSHMVKVFAVNYNVLRIMSGMGGLAYSN
jgi:hypothetical protein